MATPSTAANNNSTTDTTANNSASVDQQKNQMNESQKQQQSAGPGNNSLYVGELSVDVTEAMLFEIFNQIGPVASIRVCRDAVTRRSLGYAYVNYHDSEDCERAIENLNFSLIKGKQCRIMRSQRDPSVRKKGTGNIFIKNLDKTIDGKALYDTFSAFGDILSCKVATDENGSKGYGFVHFADDEAAQKAIDSVNGMLLNDKKVFVGHHVPRRERESKEEELKKRFTNVFVKNLPESIDDDEKFAEMFSKFGTIQSAVLSRDDDGKSKQFGFVNFEDHESAAKAVEELNGKEINEKALYVGRAQKKSEREEELRRKFEQIRLERANKYQGVNVYIKNLDEAIDDDQLRQEFSQYGNITSCKIMRNSDDGQSRGFGFVCFSSPEEATKAVAEMNGKLIGAKPVYVALAQRKEARKAMLEAQFQARMRNAAGAPGMIPMYPPAAAHMMYPGQPGQQQPVIPGMPGQPLPPQMAAAAAAAAGFYPGPAGGRPSMPPMQYGKPQFNMRMMRPNHQQQRGRMNQQGRQQQMMGYAQAGQQQRPPRGMHAGKTQMRGGNIAPVSNGDSAPKPQAQKPAQPQGLSATDLAKLDGAAQRQLIGERLYPIIQQHALVRQKKLAEMAGKLTGMLLEMEVSELLHLLENGDALSGKLEEAVKVLENFLQQQQQQ